MTKGCQMNKMISADTKARIEQQKPKPLNTVRH